MRRPARAGGLARRRPGSSPRPPSTWRRAHRSKRSSALPYRGNPPRSAAPRTRRTSGRARRSDPGPAIAPARRRLLPSSEASTSPDRSGASGPRLAGRPGPGGSRAPQAGRGTHRTRDGPGPGRRARPRWDRRPARPPRPRRAAQQPLPPAGRDGRRRPAQPLPFASFGGGAPHPSRPVRAIPALWMP